MKTPIGTGEPRELSEPDLVRIGLGQVLTEEQPAGIDQVLLVTFHDLELLQQQVRGRGCARHESQAAVEVDGVTELEALEEDVRVESRGVVVCPAHGPKLCIDRPIRLVALFEERGVDGADVSQPADEDGRRSRPFLQPCGRSWSWGGDSGSGLNRFDNAHAGRGRRYFVSGSAQGVEMKIDGVANASLDLCSRLPRGNASGQVGNIRGPVPVSVLKHDCVFHLPSSG